MSSYGKAGIRKDSWSHWQDEQLAAVVKEYEQKGLTQQEAFEVAGAMVGKTVAACQQRWHTELKDKHWAYEPGKVIPINQEVEMSVETKHDPVKHPSHYIRNGLECIDAIRAAVEGLDGYEGYCIGNAVKYCWRWKQKNGVEDVRKAKQYLDFLEVYLGERDER